MELDQGMVVANLDMATFDTEPRPLMYCDAGGHGARSRGDLRTYFDHWDDGTTKERIEQR